MLSDHEKSLLIKNHYEGKEPLKINPYALGKLPENPTAKDLLKLSNLKHKKKWINNNRYSRKFSKHWDRYVSSDIFSELMAKRLHKITQRIDYGELTKRLFPVEPLPSGVSSVFSLFYGKG